MGTNDFLQQLNQASQGMFQGASPAPAAGAGGAGISPQAFLTFQSKAQEIVSELQFSLRANEQDMGMLSDKLAAQETQIGVLQASVTELTDRAVAAEQKVILAGTELTAAVSAKETELKPAVDELATLKAEVEKLTGQVTELTGKLTTAETELAAVKKTAGKSGAEALGLKPGDEKTSEKGDSVAETEELTVEQAAEKALAAVGSADKIVTPEKLKLDYYEKLNNANMYGGEYMHDFQAWYGANQSAILQALSGGRGPAKSNRPAEKPILRASVPFGTVQ